MSSSLLGWLLASAQAAPDDQPLVPRRRDDRRFIAPLPGDVEASQPTSLVSEALDRIAAGYAKRPARALLLKNRKQTTGLARACPRGRRKAHVPGVAGAVEAPDLRSGRAAHIQARQAAWGRVGGGNDVRPVAADGKPEGVAEAPWRRKREGGLVGDAAIPDAETRRSRRGHEGVHRGPRDGRPPCRRSRGEGLRDDPPLSGPV